jgi:hypothetical protein
MIHTFRRLTATLPLICALAACGGTSSAPASIPLVQTPAAATSTTCFTPATTAQTVVLPATAGFTGSLSVAASAAAASTCDVSITFSTGSAAGAPAVETAANARSAQGVNATSAPILDISMANAFTNDVAITGTVLNTPPNLNFPDGTYYAVIVSGTLPPTVLVFTANGGVLTLQSTGQPLLIVPGTTSTLYLYARGVMPSLTNAPSPSPAPSSSASAMPSASPSALPTVTATPTSTPMPAPTPTQAPGSIVASSITISPGGCIQFGNAPASQVLTALAVTNATPGTVFEYGWAAQDVYTIAVPGTTQPILNQTVGFSNTATVSSPGFPQGSLTGSGASALVYLYLPPVPPSLTPTPVLTAGGMQASTSVRIDGGANTCPN